MDECFDATFRVSIFVGYVNVLLYDFIGFVFTVCFI